MAAVYTSRRYAAPWIGSGMTPSRSRNEMPPSPISQSVMERVIASSSPFSLRTIRQRVAQGQKYEA